MDIYLELCLGDLLKIYKINPRYNGKITTDIIVVNNTERIESENYNEKNSLCSLLFENKDSFGTFMCLSLEELEDRTTEYVVLLNDYNNNTHYSKYYNSYRCHEEILKEIYKLFGLCLNVKKYDKTDLKCVCYSFVPKDEDTSHLPTSLRKYFE